MKFHPRFVLLIFFLALFPTLSLFAQSTITGLVTNNNGIPLSNATVTATGSPTVALTDSSGKYELSVPAAKGGADTFTITAAYMGYGSVSKSVAYSETTVNFILAEDFIALSAVEVTSLKNSSVNILRTPVSVTAFQGKYIERIGASTISEFIQQAPGVTTTQLDEAYTSFQIRGISTLSGDSPAGYYLDALPFSFIGSPLVPEVNPFDLERVEVLRGPQGTLYGNGGESGVVRILTNNPDLSKLQFKADVSGAGTKGGDQNFTAQGAFNLPIVKDILALRLTGGYMDRGGFLSNKMRGRDNINEQHLSYFRAKIAYQPIKALTVRGSFWTQKNDVGTNSLADKDLDHSTPFDGEANYNDMHLYNGTIEYRFPKVHLYSATSYTTLDAVQNDGSPIFARSDTNLGQKTFNEEFRVNSVNTGAFNWLAGLYIMNGTFDQTTNIVLDYPGVGLTTVPYLATTQTSSQFSGFGELYYKFYDNKLKATAGLRYFNEKRDLEDLLPSTITMLEQMMIPAKRGNTTHVVSPRFNLAYTPTDKALIYITAANGFRSGFVQSGSYYATALAFNQPAPEFVEQENLWSYEVGTKLTSPNNKFIIESAIYYNDWRDLIQTTQQVVDVGGTPVPVIYFLNTGKAAAMGFDLNTQYISPVGLTLSLGGNINHSVYKEDTPPSIGAKKGDRISFTPRYTVSASAYYSHPVCKKLTGSVLANLQHSAERTDYSNGIAKSGDQITMLNVRTGVECKTWGVFLFANNLFNDSGATYPSNALTYNTRLRPLTAGINLKYNFN